VARQPEGFRRCDFHDRCDCHAHTLTLIEDTEGNIFGVFTPVVWESPTIAKYKTDLSLESFLFTIKNPHDFAPKKFALKANRKGEAILCYVSTRPVFRDIRVSNLGNTNSRSYTSAFGDSYANDTGLDGKPFFTGSQHFTVKEIEVFEITD
jgi:hypothetical protein